jgi:GDP-D-mannose 3', 5'-epimerase
MYWPKQRLTICVTGAGEFIGAEMAKRLKKDGHYVVACDLKRPAWMLDEEFCDEFHVVDLKKASECVRVTNLCDHVFHCQNSSNGRGRGFVSYEVSKIMHSDALITCNMIEAARLNGISRFLYVSGSEVYPDDESPCREDHAWKAVPSDGHGVTALMGEELVRQYGVDFGIECRVARVHNVYGPNMPWKDGRENVLAALCRKVLVAPLNNTTVEVWGDGTDVRSFLYLDDCIDGILEVMMQSGAGSSPINIGSKETTNVNDLVHNIASLNGKEVTVDHVPGPAGVSERVCDTTLASTILHWEPRVPLSVGLRITYDWMEREIQTDWKYGSDISTYAKSKVIDVFSKFEDGSAFCHSFASCATKATRGYFDFDWQHMKTSSVAVYNHVFSRLYRYIRKKIKSS